MEESSILRSKQAGILLCLNDQSKDWSISELAKSTGTTYVHVCNFIRDCEIRGIVESQKHGKDKMIKLTEKGRLLTSHISGIYALLDQKNTEANQTRTTA
ncbi:hypothetical protein Micr_01009 [Candidatus Micrarchaeum sp.]|jgi:predicted transcriptional regulator|uniref:MarR family winged helix-turn-helix transcriptional regulator n=1 Tax=Candidatus Micrarchaeum sp. TaxID=2282148 RepID=UPI00092C79B8|nr:MarR family winged helix-turn-helix transcriptional regulator [Candidatus Micrarchaeum sp.]OJI07708.1 MAG: hypothetical protein BK997_02415 [Candidatus Micrarchaeum sp. ARMAN-1]OJT94026.1 MAG: hypothetical protein JJ59_05055 [Candidatus Micrarchaeum sp. AZ1]OWP53855.1 MAG: hypothetical protein B2I19_00795 [Thermoplasmatales archaeon ARMAN]QRF74470.1 hypothetical protein Micr_01009 [Candidatus Micrarchaeum sp.]